MVELNNNKSSDIVAGIIVGIFTDNGPKIIYNSVGNKLVSEVQALNLLVKLMTAVWDVDRKGIYGPFPIPKSNNLLCVTYTFELQSLDAKDPRLIERPGLLLIVFNEEYYLQVVSLRDFLNKFLQKIIDKNIGNIKNLTEKRLLEINNKIIYITSQAVFFPILLKNNIAKSNQILVCIP